jgi:hypothetical protein
VARVNAPMRAMRAGKALGRAALRPVFIIQLLKK